MVRAEWVGSEPQHTQIRQTLPPSSRQGDRNDRNRRSRPEAGPENQSPLRKPESVPRCGAEDEYTQSDRPMQSGVGAVGGVEGMGCAPLRSEHRRVEGMHGEKSTDRDGS